MGLQESKDIVREAFTSYVRYATDLLTVVDKTEGSARPIFIAPLHRFRSIVDTLESSSEFKSLCSTLGMSLQRYNMPYDPAVLSSAFANFFKRSHFYNDTFARKRLHLDDLFDLFWSLVPARKVKTTRMHVFDAAWFESQHLDFGLFKIEQFSKEDLDKLTDQEVANVFYPYAKQDNDYLSQFWFTVEESIDDDDLGGEPPSHKLTESTLEQVTFDYIDRQLPGLVIQLLALHDIDESKTPVYPEAPYPLKLPFAFAVDNDLFTGLGRAASISELSPPYVDSEEDEENDEDFIIASSGLVFSRARELDLENIIAKARKVLALTEIVDDWNFIKVAMGYLGKASEMDEPLLDRLLWYVAVLDALLSEETNVSAAMRRRLGNILATSHAEKTTVRKRFDEVYDFRSQLVHGKQYKKKARTRHLYDARDLARQAVRWFIDYLLYVDDRLRRQKIGHERYPRRSELVAVLDDPGSLDRLNSLISILPKSFPKLED